MTAERTLQQRDPLAALVGRPTSYLVAIGIPFFTAIMIALNAEDVVDPILAVISLALVIATGVVFTRASSPMRAPFDRPRLVLVVGLSVLAHLFGVASLWGENAFVRDDWGPSVLGLVLLAVAPFRPARDIAVATVVSSLVVAATTVAQFETFASQASVTMLVVVAVSPVVALGLGSAVFSNGLVMALDWSRVAVASPVLTASIARSVHRDRIGILGRDVMPFITRVLDAGAVSAADRELAQQFAGEIRAVMVAEVERGWLDGVLDELAGPGGARGSIRDRARLAEALSMDQRTVLRAVLVVLHGEPLFDPSSLEIVFTGDVERTAVSLTARVALPEGGTRALLAPYLAVMQVLFADLALEAGQPALILRFAYGHR